MSIFRSFVIAVVISASSVMAQTTLYMPLLPGYITGDGDGVYDQIWFEVIRRAQIKVTFVREPYARSIARFGADETSCFPVGYAEIAKLYLGLDVIESDGFIFENLFVIATLTSENIIMDRSELAGKSIAFFNGDRPLIESSLSQNVELFSVDTYIQGFQMLNAGRVDALAGTSGDMFAFSSKIHFEPKASLNRSFERLICHPSAENKQLIEDFDAALKSMKADGTWQEILGPRLM